MVNFAFLDSGQCKFGETYAFKHIRRGNAGGGGRGAGSGGASPGSAAGGVPLSPGDNGGYSSA